METWGRVGALLTVAAVLATAGLDAQERWNLDVRAGVGIPADDLGDAELDPGAGFEGTVALRVMTHLWAYGGWGWHQFSTDLPVWGTDTDVEQTGYVFGLRFEHPFSGESGAGPAVRVHAGGTMEHLEVEAGEGDLITDSDHGAGWEAGVGVSFPAWGGWRLTPGVRYRGLSRPLAFEDITPEVYLEYVAVEVGLSRSF